MKTIPRHLKAISLVLLSVLFAPFALAQPSENSSGAISVDRSVHYAQTGAGQVVLQQTPYNFTFHVRGGSPTLKTNWGPKFYKPGSGGTVQSGTSSATNTGTLNFSDSANNGSDYMFFHEFDTNAAMEAFYPIAPTDGGQYGVKFLGSSPPTAQFTDGLVYAAGTTYPSAVPQVTAVDNGAQWVGGKLRIKPTGLTTLNLQSFTEYSSTTYGSLIAVGIYDSTTGAVVDGASKTSWYLPMGDSTEDAALTFNQTPITEITLDGSWLVAGKTYTIELQYAIIAGRPEEAILGATEFQGVSSYRRVTTIMLTAGGVTPDFDGNGSVDTVWQNTVTGERGIYLMNGNTITSWAPLGYFSTNYRIAATADYNGDGTADTVWENTVTGERGLFLMNGASRGAWVTLGYFSTNYRIAAAADFNGDGQPDTLFENTVTGERGYFISNGTALGAWVPLGYYNANYRIAGAADFNGDGKADTIWENIVTGERGLYRTNGTAFTTWVTLGYFSTDYRIVGAADFNADGTPDTLWENTNTGERGYFLTNGTALGAWVPLGYWSTNWRMAL